jgi:hypothetical protein
LTAQRVTLLLVIAALVLPIAICVLVALGKLLGAMGDVSGAAGVDRIALACGVLWVVGLIALVIVQALASLDRPEE